MNPSTTERLTARLIDAIRHNTTRPVGKGVALDELTRRARQIIAVGFAETATADGWGSTTPGNGNPGSGKGGRATMSVPGPNGPEEVPTSTTETAAFTNLGTRPPIDPALTIARTILAELHTAHRAFESIANACDRYDRLRNTADLIDAPQCYVAAVILGLPWDEAWTPHRRTTFAGYLFPPFDEERPVCRWAYDFIRVQRRLPARAEMLQHLERGTVRIHETTKRR